MASARMRPDWYSVTPFAVVSSRSSAAPAATPAGLRRTNLRARLGQTTRQGQNTARRSEVQRDPLLSRIANDM
jgi:hypothetical protein